MTAAGSPCGNRAMTAPVPSRGSAGLRDDGTDSIRLRVRLMQETGCGEAEAGVAALERVSGAAAATGALGGATGAVDRADRMGAGRALRKELPRSSHGDWEAAADRPDPVAVLVAQGESRVSELLPIRYGRMAESPFGFYRGAAAGMAADLASTPNTGIMV